MRSEVSASVHTGAFTVPDIQSLSHFCTETTQQLIHPDYFDQQAHWCRLVTLDGAFVTINVSPQGRVQWTCTEALESVAVQEWVQRLLMPLPLPKEAMKPLPQELQARFCALSPLVHIASLSLGEALIKAILRQVITAQHAKKLTDAFIRRYGARQVSDGNTYYDFPSLETIANIPLEALQREGLGFKAKVVQAVARRLVENDSEAMIAHMPPEEALGKLTAIKGIGRWTAHVALCDLHADWSCYPFEDLAVRTWARKLWNGVQWPHEERQFAEHWQHMNGEHVGIITFYLLSCAATQRPSPQYAQKVLF